MKLRVPGSKSLTHRAFVLLAHAGGTVRRPLIGHDTQATLDALGTLGRPARIEDGRVRMDPGHLHAPTRTLDCKNSGTTLRLLTAQAGLLEAPVRLTGDASLARRPNAPLLDALRQGGARIDGTDTAPYTVHGPLHAGTYTLPARISSQYASALLFALPFLPGDSTLHLGAPVASRPYLDLSLDLLARHGIPIEEADGTFLVPGSAAASPIDLDIEPDWSTAAFPLVAAAITGRRLELEGMRMDSLQGDRRILELLASFGARVTGAGVDGGTLTSPGTIDVQDTPDLFPILCILAAASRGTTTFTGGAALRHKESDRIAAMADGLQRLGIEARERPDGLAVTGGTLRGGTIDARKDHRVHMAFAIAGLVATGPVSVSDPECVAVSYPGFRDMLSSLETP